ncbi:hypothetical protein CA54_05470 [Symmachiella macrocystis]|uniref:Uncharacterized protein n=1 Tax=Symmachiella macrocystis TaxID=2527985 RepID=A0A5C6BI49_9PLAN|nr:hypothetical protein [Symmachiella macrocystis]TWU11738.1 hypothetical protein CA54_05470 [Symmachiella macrocystis]
MSQLKHRHWAVKGFRWIVTGLDLVCGICLTSLGVAVMFGTSLFVLIGINTGGDAFRSIPDGAVGVLVIGYGLWLCFSGIRLVTEHPPIRWEAGKRRHWIAAIATGLMIALMWLALMADLAMYDIDGFGHSVHVIVYTGFLACAIPFLLVASAVMSRLDRNCQSDNPHKS